MEFYRKKTAVVEAFQWAGGPEPIEDPVWMAKAIAEGKIRFINAGMVMKIQTSFGVVTAYAGEWIVRDPKGNLLPHDEESFKEQYVAIEPGDPGCYKDF